MTLPLGLPVRSSYFGMFNQIHFDLNTRFIHYAGIFPEKNSLLKPRRRSLFRIELGMAFVTTVYYLEKGG
ncbi:MAG: hypothetical protein AABY76_00625, partial [Planctomycetota bacterium]